MRVMGRVRGCLEHAGLDGVHFEHEKGTTGFEQGRLRLRLTLIN